MKKETEKIKELLNAYIDGELSDRRKNEVKRLIDNDPKIQAYINKLIKGRNLMASITNVKAPEGIEQAVMERLERRLILDESDSSVQLAEGRRSHYMRRMVGAAAMVALFAFLSLIVFQVVSPTSQNNESPVAVLQELEPLMISEDKVAVAQVYTLRLNTSKAAEFSSEIDGNLERLGLAGDFSKKAGYNSYIYEINCSAAQAERLVLDLQEQWGNVEGADLVFDSGIGDEPIQIADVEMPQILSLISSETDQAVLEKAKRYAKSEDTISPEPIKPRLTGPESVNADGSRKIILKITVKSSR